MRTGTTEAQFSRVTIATADAGLWSFEVNGDLVSYNAGALDTEQDIAQGLYDDGVLSGVFDAHGLAVTEPSGGIFDMRAFGVFSVSDLTIPGVGDGSISTTNGAFLTLWRKGVTNAAATVTLTIDPAIAGATAVAYTDGAGPNQGRIDIAIPSGAAAGTHTWSAEIAAVQIWDGYIEVGPHGYPTSCLSSSYDIQTERVPAWYVARPVDVEGGDLGGGPATQIDETGGPTTLDIAAIADGEFLKRVGTDVVGASGGSGDVTAAVAFGTDERLIRSDGTGKGVQASTIAVTDAGVVTGVDDLTLTGSITMSALETVDGRDVSVDGATLDALSPVAVTAAATFATDERLLRSDGTGRGSQASAIAVTDAGAMSGMTSITASGAISGSNLSGTNTGDQTITLTGDVTGTGTGSFAATIASDAVTYAKMQNVSAASKLLGRGDSGSGDPQEITLGSGLSMTGTTLAASGASAITFGDATPSGGADGDTYLRDGPYERWARAGGTWSRDFTAIQMGCGPGGMHVAAIQARYNSTSVNVFGGANATAEGTAAGAAFATTNARTSRNRTTYTPGTSANTAASGTYTAGSGALSVDSTHRAGRLHFVNEWGITSVTQSNFRFFSGLVTATTFATDPTSATHGLSDRIGLAVDANTSLAAKWIVNDTNTNRQNAAAHTLVADRWYRHHIWCEPGSQTIYQELWEWSSISSDPTLVASTSHALVTAYTWSGIRGYVVVANAGTAAASGTLEHGQTWIMSYP